MSKQHKLSVTSELLSSTTNDSGRLEGPTEFILRRNLEWVGEQGVTIAALGTLAVPNAGLAIGTLSNVIVMFPVLCDAAVMLKSASYNLKLAYGDGTQTYETILCLAGIFGIGGVAIADEVLSSIEIINNSAVSELSIRLYRVGGA